MSRRTISHRRLKKNSIGDLRDRIILKIRAINAPLFSTANFHQQFTIIKTAWAKVETPSYAGSGENKFNDVALASAITHVFTIRYDADNVITAEAFVEWEDNHYRILKTINPEERNEYQELRCQLLGDKDLEANQ